MWFVCHGYRQLARFFLRAFLPFAGPDRLFVAPEALSRFYLDRDTGPHAPDARIGATWMTREDRDAEITDYVGWLDVLHARILGKVEGDDVRVRALGFSQGAHTASRWIALGDAAVDELVLWSGGFPADYPWEAALPRLRPLELTLVAGTEDSWATPDRVSEEAESLRERGLSPRVVVFEGGHRVTEAGLRAVIARQSNDPRT